jgi:large subunit ribosomal protein L19
MELKNIKVAPIDVDARKAIDMKPGDTVRVWQKIQEGEKIRLQAFEGLVLAIKHGKENGSTFTVRKIIDGVGVERIFPLYSPTIDEIEVIKRASKVRRAKLYYIREKANRDIKKKMKSELLRARQESKTDTSEAKKVKEEAKKSEAETKTEEKKEEIKK